MSRMTGLALSVAAIAVAAAGAWAANTQRPGSPPRGGPVSSDVHRNYGAPATSRGLPARGAGDVRDRAGKQPYDYRYYSDTDRSPASCRRFARRAIATKNANWWTRYRACLQ